MFECDWSSDVCASDLVNVALTHDVLAAVTTPNQSITIADQQLTTLATATLPAGKLEGAGIGAISGIATFTDPAGAEVVGDYTATINWGDGRSEERRVGKECRSRWPPDP